MKSRIAFSFVVWSFLVAPALAQEGTDRRGAQVEQNPSRAATAAHDPIAVEQQRNAIKNVDFLAGHWSGTEWVLIGDGSRQNVEAFDFAEVKLHGTLLLFQGVVKAKIPPSMDLVVVYEGLGLLSYDEGAQKYRLQHFGTDGAYEAYDCTLSGKALHCERRDKDGALTRITISLDDAGRWIEHGERSQDGKTWQPFFEVQMEKIPAGSEGSK